MPTTTLAQLPAGYELVPPRRIAPQTLRARPAAHWRQELALLASTRAGLEGAWQTLGNGSAGARLSLNDRGAVEVARHRSRPNIYRLTDKGARILREGR